MHTAAFYGDPAAILALIEAGADPAARNEWEETPADIARRNNLDEAVTLLQVRSGETPEP